MQAKHLIPNKYFTEQTFTSEKYVLPLISKVKDINRANQFLRSDGEAGHLVPFLKKGAVELVRFGLSGEQSRDSDEDSVILPQCVR